MNNFTINLGQRIINLCSHLFSNIKFKKQFLLFFTFIFLFGINSAFSQTTGTCTPADNPAFPTDCETCIIVVLDESGSIGSINTQIVGALKDFVEVLNNECLDVNMAIVEYSSLARVASIGGSTAFQDVNDAYETALATYLAGGGSGASSYNPGGGTNWDQGLQVANTLAASASCANPYIVMISDGNPTYYGTGPSGPGNDTTTAVLEAACNAANTLKNDGKRIFTIAIPNPTVTTSYVQAITDGAGSLEYVTGTPGANETNDIRLADYLVTTSADVGDAFAALAAGIAEPTISASTGNIDFEECNPTFNAPTFTVNHDCQNNATPTVDIETTNDGCNYTRTYTASYEHVGPCPAVAQDVVITYTWFQDTEAPVITNCPIEAIDLGDNPQNLPTVVDAEAAAGTATDNCGIKSKVATAGQIVEDGCISTQTFEVIVTDNCDQTATCNVVYTWTKDCCVPPQIVCPNNVEVECDESTDPANTGTATSTEGCGDVDITYNDVVTPGNCAGNYTITRTWTATDENQDTATCNQIITVSDTTDPEISGVGADGTFECGSSPVFSTPTASDTCDSNVTLTFVDTEGATTCAGTAIVRTWTATDDCGRTATASQTLTPVDTTAPSITPPAGGVIACDADPVFGIPTYSDNCNGVTITSVDSETGNSCGGSYTRTWTATDACGNAASASQTFTYSDTQAPIITCPANVTVEFGGDTSSSSTGVATATDNCSQYTITESDSSVPGCGNTEVITRTWTATDACGNQSSCEQTINVTDTTPPEVTCPTDPNLSACATEDEIEAAYNSWVAGFSATGDNVTSNIASIPTLPDFTCAGAINLSFTLEATDGCTTVECSSTFTVAAAPALELSCPDLIAFESCVDQAEIDSKLATWRASFTYSGGCNAYATYDVRINGQFFFGITQTEFDNLVFTANSCGASIEVVMFVYDDCTDIEPQGCGSTFGVVSAPDLQVTDVGDKTVEACDYTNQGELDAAFATFLSEFGESGGCNPQGSFADQYVAPDLCAGGSVVVTYNVTDLCENGEDTATFTVNATAPVDVSCPAPVALGSSLTEQEIIDAYNAWKAGFTVSGGCNPTDNLAGFPSLPNYDCGTGVDLSFTLDASDRCGSDSCSSTFKVEGVVGLTVDCPAPVSLDACATQDDIEAAYATWAAGFAVNDGDNPTSNIADIPTLEDFVCGGAIDLSFTLTAFDDCNPNGVSCGSTFTVGASDELVVVCSSPVVLNSPVTSQEIQDAYNSWVAGFSVSGGCNASSNINSIPALPDYVCGQAIDLSFDLEATDDCGTKSCSSSFYVEPTDSVEAGEGESLVICEGGSVTAEDLYAQLTGADEGGSWSPEPSGAGIYTYTVYGTDPCPNDTAIVEVTEQIIEITAGELVCGEQSDYGFYTADVTTNGGNVTSDYGTPNNNGGNSWTITGIPNGQNVTVTVITDLQCESSLEIEAPDCFCIELYYEYTNVTCFGLDDGTITVTGVSEGATVTINGQPYDANMLYAPGSYIIKAFYEGVDIDECIFEEKIGIVEPDLVNINAVGTDVTCYGANDGTITVSNLSAGAIYTIKKNGLGADLSGQTYFSPGMYIVKAFLPASASDPISGGGQSRSYDPCESIVIVNISQPNPLASKLFTGFGSKVDCKNPENNWIAAKVIGQGQITYTWSLSPKSILNGWGIVDDTAGSIIQIIPGQGSATYYLAIQDETGCVSESSIDVFSKCANNYSFNNVTLYPNPVKDMLNVKFDAEIDSDVTIEVYNLVGTKMFANTFNSNGKRGTNDMKIDFSRFPSHVYYVKIITKNGTIIKKVVLDK